MDFRQRDRLVEGCNWLMVGVAAGWVAYTFAGSLFSPADSQARLLPSAIVQSPPPSTEMAPVPVWGTGNNTVPPSSRATDSNSKPSRAVSRSDQRPRRFGDYDRGE